MGEETEELNLDESKLEQEAAKIIGDDEASSESATEEKESKEETSKEESSRTDTSLKTEEESKEEKETKEEETTEKTEKEEEESGEETRFDKHPRFQKLRQERDEALEKAQSVETRVKELESIKSQLGNLDPQELNKLKEGADMLRKYPQLAEKVQQVIDEHNFGSEEAKTEFVKLQNSISEMQTNLLLEKYDNTVDKVLSEKKVDEDVSPIVKEILDKRVSDKKLTLKDVPKELESILKSFDKIYRKNLASHVEVKNKETKVPTSATQRGKVIVAKKEPVTDKDFIDELAEGLKSLNKADVTEEG